MQTNTIVNIYILRVYEYIQHGIDKYKISFVSGFYNVH